MSRHQSRSGPPEQAEEKLVKENSRLIPLAPEKTETRFLERNQFTFDRHYSAKHTLLLLPSEVPLSGRSREVDITLINSDKYRGLRPDIGNVKLFEAKRKQYAAMGMHKMPKMLLKNSNTAIPENLTPDNKINSYAQLKHFNGNKDQIVMVILDGASLAKSYIYAYKKLQEFKNLEILSMKGCSLTKLPIYPMKKLRICYMCDNDIDESSGLVHFASTNPLLSLLDVRRNPVAQTQAAYNEVVASAFNLKYYNGREITPRDRVFALKHAKNNLKEQDISQLHFYFTVKAIPEVSVLSDWSPAMLAHLSLPNAELTGFSVYYFPNLTSLNLSGNKITTIRWTGITKCTKLISIDLSNNMLDTHNELHLFKYCDSLQHIWLKGNTRMGHYRADLIRICAELAGTAAHNGLQSIDGLPVTIMELSKSTSINLGFESSMWRFNLDRALGNSKIKSDANLFKKVHSIQWEFRGLTAVNASFFANLTHLSLRGNSITHIHGLSHCARLVYLDISENSELDINYFLTEAQRLKQLQFLMLSLDCWSTEYNEFSSYEQMFLPNAPRRSSRNKQYREYVLDTLVPCLPYFSSLDRMRISVSERINVLITHNLNKEQAELYRIYVAIIQAAIPKGHIDLCPQAVTPGVQYNPHEIESLIRLEHSHLKSVPLLRFDKFVNLTELNLSYNKLTTITTLELHKLKRLRILDVSHNRIKDSYETLGNIIDAIPVLEIIAIRDNPCMAPDGSRIELLKQIARLHTVDDPFRVLDYEISPSEVVKTRNWSSRTTSDDKKQFHLLTAIKIRTPRVSPDRLIDLDLAGCNLRFVNLSKMVNLRRAYLSNNLLSSHIDLKGVENASKLQVLDLSFNKIEKLNAFVFIINALPELINIGARNNPCTVSLKKARIKIISELYCFSSPQAKFMALDDTPVTPSEIMEAQRTLTVASIGEFSFNMAIFRNIPNPTVLDLSHAQLSTYLDFSAFPELVELNLSNNKLFTQVITMSSLDKCLNLKLLDLSNNDISLIESGTQIGSYLSLLTELEQLNIQGNPICQGAANYKDFMTYYIRMIEPGCALQKINGIELNLEKRSQIVQWQTRSNQEAELYKCKYLLYQQSPDYKELTSADLSNSNLTSFAPVSGLSELTTLDLSDNNITTLYGQGFENMKSLVSLNLRNNNITNINEIKEVLSHCPKLEELYILNSTADRAETNDPKKYVGFICSTLRGLRIIDGYDNPRQLTNTQLNSLKDLEQITGWYNPNHIHEIDLANKGISSKDLPTVLLALGALAPRDVRLAGNPCCDIENFRFIVIFNVPDVVTIDGELVTIDQRMNADTSVRRRAVAKKADAFIVNGVAMGTEFLYNSHSGSNTAMLSTASTYAARFGSALMKWEIFITFQQILSQIMDLIERIKWPSFILSFSWVIWPFTIDFSFLSYILEIKLPFWYSYLSFFLYVVLPPLLFGLYHIQLQKDFWYSAFSTGWTRTRRLSYFGLFMMIVCSAGIAFLADANYTLSLHKFNNNQLAWFTVLCAISVVAVITFWIIAWEFRKHMADPVMWFKFLKYKKRFSLFILTVLYYPICKSFVEAFQCEDGATKYFADVSCATSFSDVQLIHIASFVFGIIYAIGVPWFFIKLINKGVREIDLNYRINVKYEQLEEKKKELKKLSKEGIDTTQMAEEVEKTEKAVGEEYSRVALEYDNAAAYLYNAYDRHNRYKKVISMLEKLLYLLFSVFMPTQWVKSASSTVLMALATGFQFIAEPFAAISENILEGAAKLFNLLSLLVGNSLQFDWIPAEIYTSAISGYVIVGLIAILFVAFFYFLIRYHCCTARNPEYEQLENEESSTNEVPIENADEDLVHSIRTLHMDRPSTLKNIDSSNFGQLSSAFDFQEDATSSCSSFDYSDE